MVIQLQPGPPVPPAYIGVWKRTLLRTPEIEDTTTQVVWMQTQSWHADIRVPAGRPAFAGKAGPDQLNRTELLELARQQGFCGTTVVDEDICRWLRRHDFQPPSGANDIGRMVFDTPDRVFEYGVETDYFEIWERVPVSAGESSANQLSADPLTLLLTMGPFFMIVRPRAIRLPQATCLADFAAEKCSAELRQLVDFEISFGRRGNCSDTWRIELSTLPWQEGADIPMDA
ncbi:MAG: hypothetical protein HY067_22085 [Betaproteobacteria bacterium]|nr:hypothetical protein [Betaproteobacteria bacterium]